MKIAVIGSRTLTVRNLEKYIPKDTTEIISGGANGIDRCAKEFAVKNNIRYTEFLPEYKIHGRYAPLKRNLEIIDNACFRHSKVMRTNKNASEPCSGDRCNSFIILFFSKVIP